jgi:FtsP/CotA-like multicopper oxidase with cupredoxin domain
MTYRKTLKRTCSMLGIKKMYNTGNFNSLVYKLQVQNKDNVYHSKMRISYLLGIITTTLVGANGIKRFNLTIKSTLLNPDCFNQSYPSLVVNDQFPAPALHVVKNDIIQVHIHNDASNNVSTSIHFHGIRQYGTVVADGVAGITQLAIAPGQDYTQEFQVLNQTGTFYYHAHVGVQDDTVQGPLIVYENQDSLVACNSNQDETLISEGPYQYDGEFILQWSEWWHQSFHDRQDFYMSAQFKGDGGPDSFLLNGQSIYPNTSSQDCPGFTYFDVKPNKTYRLRHIGALTFRMLGLFIEDHPMTLIEIDGEYVQPFDIKYLELAAGQRMSVLIHTGNYTAGSVFPIATNYRWRALGVGGYTPNGYGFLRYVDDSSEPVSMLTIPSNFDLPTDLFPIKDTPGWVLKDVKPEFPGDPYLLNGKAKHTIKLGLKEVLLADNTTRFVIEGRPFVEHPWGNATASLLDQVLEDQEVGILKKSDGFSIKHQTYPVGFGEIVDLVFQNYFLPTNICAIHPWHTHGHSHYLLAEGAGEYIHELHKDTRTFETPLWKDVSLAYPATLPNSTNLDGCGWTKVRLFTVSIF